MKLNKSQKIVVGLFICFFVVTGALGVGSVFLIENLSKKHFEEYAWSYLSENSDLIGEIGEVQSYECLGREETGDQDGLPVHFEVKAEKGDFHVILWFTIISFDPDEYEIVKHSIEPLME